MMQIGDMFVYLDRLDENNEPIRFLALCIRIDNPGVGLTLPELTCRVFPPVSDSVYAGASFEQAGVGLWPFGSNYVGTFEPIEASE